VRRERQVCGADADLREAAGAGGSDSPAILRESLQHFEGAREGNNAAGVFDFAALDLAILCCRIGAGEEFANGGDAGASVGLADDFFGDEAVLVGPDGPDAGDGGRGVDQDAVQVEEDAAAVNFHLSMIPSSATEFLAVAPRNVGADVVRRGAVASYRTPKLVCCGDYAFRINMKRKLQVMKFGGTSVGDAGCIARSARIVAEAGQGNAVVAVVSAMSGVTNRLVEAANRAGNGDREAGTALIGELRRQHETALASIVSDPKKREGVAGALNEILAEGQRLLDGTALLRELTARALDAISSLGERLCAPIFAAALAQLGVKSRAIAATELIVTDTFHGGAEPRMDLTRACCESALRPLLNDSCVPVATGFIGATADGVLTTLGRGGSDYSATILGAALGVDEVIIWTDVDGVLTADPRLVPDARTIPEISYREAAELAYFGAKVLHPKTLRTVMPAGIPVWIRNSFAPERPGTKISQQGRSIGGGVKALTAIRDVALISVGGPGIVGVPDVVGRTFSTTAELRANVLLISQSSSQNDICFIVAAADAQRTVEALRREFASDLSHEVVEHITVDPKIAIVAVVGENMRGTRGMAGRTFAAMGRDNVNIIAIAQGSSETNISFVVEDSAMKQALLSAHKEFGLGA
jgi:bifunctional aspartokinase / homoserine dehydrogenase 1